MGKKNKEKDLFNEKSKKDKKAKKRKPGPGIRILTLSSIRDAIIRRRIDELAAGAIMFDELKIPYFTKTGIQKNLKYDDKTKIRITVHQKFVLYKKSGRSGEYNAITSGTQLKDHEDFLTYELNFVDFINDLKGQVFWSVPSSVSAEDKGEKPLDFYLIDSTSKAKEPQKYAITEKSQSVATLIKVTDDKDKDFCQVWFEI